MATYGSAAGVNALVLEWDGATSPTPTQVGAWLTEAYSKINRALGSAGYVMPADAQAAVYAELTGLENLYAAAYTLRARGIDTASGQTEERSEVWLKDFYSQLKDLAASDLTLLGLSLIATAAPTRRRRLRTVQMRRVDGYSGHRRFPVSSDMDYAEWVEQISQGEYTTPTMPTE